MQIADSIGVASDQAYLLSKNFTLLAYDLSSFLNIDIESAMEKLRSGLVGEVEPLRAVGYAITENTLQQTLNEAMTRKQYEAYKKLNPEIAENTNIAILNENAVGMNVRKLTEAQKVELRYVAIMNQATKAMTDMSETLNTPANQMRILRQQIEMTGRVLGNIFIPILNKVLPVLIAFAQIVREIANVLSSLFGFKLPEVDWERDFASGAGAATDAIDDVTDATEKAKKAAKDFTAPFDELNILKKDTSSSAGAGDEEGALGGGALFEQLPDYTSFLQDAIGLNVDDIKGKLEDLLQLVAAIAAGLAAWKIAQALLDNLPKIKEQFVKIRDTINDIHKGNGKLGEGIGKNTILAGSFGFAVGVWGYHFLELYRNSEQFRKGLERIQELFDTISEAIGILADGIYLYIIEPILDIPIIGDILNMFVQSFKEIKDFLSGMGLDIFGSDLLMILTGVGLIVTKINPVVGIITLIIEGVTILIRVLGNLDNGSWQNFKDGIINGAKGIVDALRNLPETVGNIVENVKETMKNTFDNIATTLNFDKLKEDAKNAFDSLATTITELPSKIGEIPNTIATMLGGAFDNVASFWTTAINNAWSTITGLFSTAVDTVIGYVTDFATNVGNGFDNLATMAKNAFDNLIDTITGLPDKLAAIPDTIKNMLTPAFDDRIHRCTPE